MRTDESAASRADWLRVAEKEEPPDRESGRFLNAGAVWPVDRWQTRANVGLRISRGFRLLGMGGDS